MPTANLVNSWMLTGLPIEDFDELERKVDSLTVEQVNAAAKKYILPEKMTIVVVGDKSKISEQLAPFAPEPPK